MESSFPSVAAGVRPGKSHGFVSRSWTPQLYKHTQWMKCTKIFAVFSLDLAV